jgi:hypothetical protein
MYNEGGGGSDCRCKEPKKWESRKEGRKEEREGERKEGGRKGQTELKGGKEWKQRRDLQEFIGSDETIFVEVECLKGLTRKKKQKERRRKTD